MVPVGIPPPGALAVTAAWQVTDCPCTEGLGSHVRAVVVDALSMVSSVVPREVAKLALEAEVKVAATAWMPTARSVET